MDDLSKQQLILLALLVSFVTSLATGIVTVSLMDQTPTGVTRTVSQVIEKTIQQIAPQDASVADSGESASPAAAVAAIQPSLVAFAAPGSSQIAGIGIVVSKSGVMVADKADIPAAPGDPSQQNFTAILNGGVRITVSIIQSQNDGDLVFLAPTVASTTLVFAPAPIAPAYRLADAVYSLSGTSTTVLGQGVISESMPAASSSLASFIPVKTSVPLSQVMPGSPLFDENGRLIGMAITSLQAGASGAQFLPALVIKQVVPKF